MKKHFKQKTLWCILLFSILALYIIFNHHIAAYLTDKDTITNTFVMGILVPDAENDFVIAEHKITDDDKNGVYTLGSEEVKTNSYYIFPAVNLPKDPFVRLQNLQANAYLFIEITGPKSDDFLWSVTENWKETSLTGKYGGTVFIYQLENQSVLHPAENFYLETYILSSIDESPNGGIQISDAFNTDAPFTFTVKGYLLQADGFNSYTEAWNSCV